jgi:hypothetical protein
MSVDASKMAQPMASTIWRPDMTYGFVEMNADGSSRVHTAQFFRTDEDRKIYAILNRVTHYAHMSKIK